MARVAKLAFVCIFILKGSHSAYQNYPPQPHAPGQAVNGNAMRTDVAHGRPQQYQYGGPTVLTSGFNSVGKNTRLEFMLP